METTEREEAARRHAEHYKDVLGLADDLYLQGTEVLMRGLALFDMEWGNIQAGQVWAASRAAADREAARLGGKIVAIPTFRTVYRIISRAWSDIKFTVHLKVCSTSAGKNEKNKTIILPWHRELRWLPILTEGGVLERAPKWTWLHWKAVTGNPRSMGGVVVLYIRKNSFFVLRKKLKTGIPRLPRLPLD